MQPTFIMTPPTHFKVAYSINYFMHPETWKDKYHKQAKKQWDNLFDTLKHCGANIRLQWPEPDLPDMCFTANHAFVLDRKALMANFKVVERRPEEPLAYQTCETLFRLGLLDNVQKRNNIFFEGQGDCLYANGAIFFSCYGRSTILSDHLNEIWPKYRIMPVILTDHRFYHLDTCFCPLSNGTIILYPGAIGYGAGPSDEFVYLNEKEALDFAANSIEINGNLITPCKRKSFLKKVEKAGYNPIYVDMSAFKLAGGACACLVLRI